MINNPGKKGKILLAEADELSAMAIRSFFQKKGYSLDSVFDAKSVLVKYQTEHYGLILIDTHLDSLTITRKIRRQESISMDKFTPIIGIVSANSDEKESFKKYFQAGINDVVKKPFLPEKVNFLIEKYLLPEIGFCDNT